MTEAELVLASFSGLYQIWVPIKTVMALPPYLFKLV